MPSTPNPEEPVFSAALSTLWNSVCSDLTKQIGEAEFDRWFSTVNLVRLEPDALWISAPNPIYSLWIEENYLRELTASVAAHLPSHPPIRFEIASSNHPLPLSKVGAPESQSSIGDSPKEKTSSQPKSQREERTEPASPDPKRLKQSGLASGLSEVHRFDNFVVGAANRLAAAAAKAVAEKPGKTYHPLFIYSASGLGKTHLLHAIGWDSLKRRPRSKVIYITAERFANDYIEAIQKNNLVAFRKRFREADMLLIDDVQFLSGKEGMQEEFFHTFNSVTDRHKQIVLASDRPAAEIRELEERLVSRFKWGMTAEIVAPGPDTRVAILRRKREERSLEIPDWVIDFISERVTSNVRALEGALLRSAALTSIQGEEGTLCEESLEKLLADYVDDADSARQVSVQEIIERVAEHYDISPREITGKRRTSRLVEARHVAMALAREKTDLSLAEIGKEFGGRDHGTVINACRKVASKVDSNPSTRRTLDFLRRNLLLSSGGRGGASR
ncbi:MAG: chromosomal replication initiator protein DnaA [Verrucomicrobiae bacterium]|nr:chromosomal replication initiator protein DnaA [Verrucomicrobiae bacterium]